MVVFVGAPIVVGDDVQVTIDCSRLIDEAINNGIPNPTVTWFKDGAEISNGSVPNVKISADKRFCIITSTAVAIGGQLGSASQYTCEVFNNTIFMNKTSRLFVCGKDICLMLLRTVLYFCIGYPKLAPPVLPPMIFPTVISLTCGQDITVETLVGVNAIIIQCRIFNGSYPVTTQVFKDGELISNSFQLAITSASNDDFGTYTFVASTEGCGSTSAVSRILLQG